MAHMSKTFSFRESLCQGLADLVFGLLCGSFVCPVGRMVVPVLAGGRHTSYASSIGTRFKPRAPVYQHQIVVSYWAVFGVILDFPREFWTFFWSLFVFLFFPPRSPRFPWDFDLEDFPQMSSLQDLLNHSAVALCYFLVFLWCTFCLLLHSNKG